MKSCSRCGQSKPLDAFRKRASTNDGLRTECRQCQDAYNRGYFAATKDRKSLYDRDRYLANREEIAREREEYRAVNHELIRQYQRQRRRSHPDYMKKWRAANRERSNGYVHKRRALKQGAKSEPYTLAAVWAKTDGRCGICELPVLASQVAEIDHIVPISRGGDDTLANVQISHSGCNRTKWAHSMESGESPARG